MLTIALATPSLFGGMSPLLELMLAPTSSAYALAQSWESLAAAEGAYRRLSILRIVQAAIVLGIQVSVGLLQPSVEGLALAVMMGIALTLTLSAWFFPLRLPPVGTRRTMLVRAEEHTSELQSLMRR